MSDEVKRGGAANLTAPRFQKGQSGNPGGKPTGTRNKLSGKFLNALLEDFEENGVTAIESCRKEDPAAYVRVLASLLPKEIEVRRPLEDFEDDELIDAVRALQSFLAAQSAESGVGAPGEPTQTH